MVETHYTKPLKWEIRPKDFSIDWLSKVQSTIKMKLWPIFWSPIHCRTYRLPCSRIYNNAGELIRIGWFVSVFATMDVFSLEFFGMGWSHFFPFLQYSSSHSCSRGKHSLFVTFWRAIHHLIMYDDRIMSVLWKVNWHRFGAFEVHIREKKKRVTLACLWIW